MKSTKIRFGLAAAALMTATIAGAAVSANASPEIPSCIGLAKTSPIQHCERTDPGGSWDCHRDPAGPYGWTCTRTAWADGTRA